MSNGNYNMSGQLSRYDGKRTDWVTDSKIPDPEVLPEILGWNILVRPIEPEGELNNFGKEGNKLFLPDSFTEDIKYLTNVGRVVAMGESCYNDPSYRPGENGYPWGRYKKPWCKVGDYVVWGRHQGTKVRYSGVAFVLLADELILMTLKDPSQINPMFNAFK